MKRLMGILSWVFCLLLVLFVVTAGAEFFSQQGIACRQGFEYREFGTYSTPSAETLFADWIFDANAPVLSSPSIVDVDGDSAADIILTTYGQGPNPYAEGYIYVLDMMGDTLTGWPRQTGAPFAASCVAGDLDGDGAIELVTGDWGSAYAWESDGSNLLGWPRSPGAYVTPALADLDWDSDLEIVYCGTDSRVYVWQEDGTALPGWPFDAPELVGPPAVADIDGDDTLEIVAATYQGPVGPDSFQVYAWEASGSVIPGFPVWTSGVNKSAPAIGDIDLDGDQEIIIVSYHSSNSDFVYAFDGSGNLEPGWPVRADYVRLSSPALGDIDGDDDLEVLVGGYDPGLTREKLFAYHHDGMPVSGWPRLLDHPGASGNINSSVIVADIDGMQADYETCWPLYKHDPCGTCAYPESGIAYSEPEILVKVVDHIYALHPDGNVVDGFPFFLDDESHTGTHSPSPAIADVDGDGSAELVFVSSSGILAFLDLKRPGTAEDVWSGKARAAPRLEVAPSPFGQYTVIVAAGGGEVDIFDVTGKKVRKLCQSRARWFGEDDHGCKLPSGMYFVVTSNGREFQTAKVIIAR